MSVYDSLIKPDGYDSQSTPSCGMFNSQVRGLDGGQQAALGYTVEDKLHRQR